MRIEHYSSNKIVKIVPQESTVKNCPESNYFENRYHCYNFRTAFIKRNHEI